MKRGPSGSPAHRPLGRWSTTPRGASFAYQFHAFGGAAAAVLLSDAKAKALDVTPLGRFRAFTVQGVPPGIMGIAPVPAIRALLAKVDLKIENIDLFELARALRALGFDDAHVFELARGVERYG